MGCKISIIDELFGLKKGITATDIRRALQQIRQETTKDPANAQAMARNALATLQKYGRDLAQKQSHRRAAEQYYTGARLIREFFPDQAELSKEWYRSTGDSLIHASQNYKDFGEFDGAAAIMVVRSILLFLGGTWEVDEAMNAFVRDNESYFGSSQTASAVVHIPYELVKAYTNLDRDALHKAETYIQSYLLRVKVVELFAESIQEVILAAKEKFSQDVKLPRIRADLKHSQDLLFGRPFQINLALENVGEGEAKSLSYSISLESGLQLRRGQKEGQIATLLPNASTSLEFQLTSPTGEGTEELTQQISVSVSYDDILGNRQSVVLGPYELVFRPKLKSEELKNNLLKIQEASKTIINTLKTNVSTANKTQPLADSILSIFEQQMTEATQMIKDEEFGKAELLIQTSASMLKNIGSKAHDLFEEVQKQGIVMEELLERSESKIKDLTAKLEEMKKNLIEIESILKY
ncbi:MAG: hypothetical protein ACFFC7_05260 [Candidatus Hermodarchaeota archaeon]